MHSIVVYQISLIRTLLYDTYTLEGQRGENIEVSSKYPLNLVPRGWETVNKDGGLGLAVVAWRLHSSAANVAFRPCVINRLHSEPGCWTAALARSCRALSRSICANFSLWLLPQPSPIAHPPTPEDLISFLIVCLISRSLFSSFYLPTITQKWPVSVPKC